MSANRLFGRYSRCFLVLPVKPPTLVSVDDRIQPSVVIKDSWTIYNTAPNKDEAICLEFKVSGLYIDDDNNPVFAWSSANPSLNTRKGSDEIAALNKSDLSIQIFKDNITRDFRKQNSNGADGERLEKLSIYLYQTMFFNPRFGAAPDCPYHGTREYCKCHLTFLLEDNGAENSENVVCGNDLIDTASYQINSEKNSVSSADPFEEPVKNE